MVTSLTDQKFRIEDCVGRMPENVRWELVEGELVLAALPSGGHGLLTAEIAYLLGDHIRKRGIDAAVLAGDPGFVLQRNPDTFRGPDVAVVRGDRAPSTQDESLLHGPPDLAVEIASKSQTRGFLQDKAQGWIDAGGLLAWVVLPRTRQVEVFRPGRPPVTLSADDTLTAEPVLPGFAIGVADLFV